MDTQLGLVFAIIVLSALYLMRSTWRTWFGSVKVGCGSGCGGCSAKKEAEEPANGRISLKQI